MPAQRPALVAFPAGEWTELLEARTDLARYAGAAQQLENFLPTVQGAAVFRPGTRFIAELKNSAVQGRLVPFVYSAQQSYQFELGDQVARIFRNKAPIELPAVGAQITGDSSTFAGGLGAWVNASTGGNITHDAAVAGGTLRLDPGGPAGNVARAQLSVPTTSIGIGHVIRFRLIKPQWRPDAPVVFAAPVNTTFEPRDILEEGWHTVTVTPTASPFTIEFSLLAVEPVGSFHAWIKDVVILPAGPLELPTPWPAAALPRIKWSQSRDVLWIFHPDYPTHKIERRGNTDWALKRVVWKDGPFEPVNTTATTLAPTAASGNMVAVNASSRVGINDGRGFAPTDVQRTLRLKKASGDWAWGVITAVNSATQIIVQIIGDFGTTPVRDWRLGRFHDGAGYPGAGGFYEQRFMLGGLRNDNQRLLGSMVGNFETFSPTQPNGTVADDNAIDYALDDNQANPIRWIAPALALLVGTGSAQWRVGRPSGNSALSPTNRDAKPQAWIGAADMLPSVVNDAVLFVGASRIDLHELRYDVGADGYSSSELTVFAEHIGAPGISEIVWQQTPWRVEWAVRDNGELAGLTYLREQEFQAWHRHPMPNGFVERISVIPADPGAAQASRDQLWMIVRRRINGQTKRYIEVMEDPFPRPFGNAGRRDDAWFLDCALRLDNRIDAVLTPGAGATEDGKPGVVFSRAPGAFAPGDVGKEIHFDWTDTSKRAGQRGYHRKAVARIDAVVGGNAICGIEEPFPNLDPIPALAWRQTVTVITGLDHLENELVGVVGDGEVIEGLRVVGGQLAIEAPGVSKAIVGLRYTGRLIPMPLEAALPQGTSAGSPKRVTGVTLSLFRSLGGRVGRAETEDAAERLFDIEYRLAGSDVSQALELFTGRRPVPIDFGNEDPANLVIEQQLPLPFTLRAIYPRFQA